MRKPWRRVQWACLTLGLSLLLPLVSHAMPPNNSAPNISPPVPASQGDFSTQVPDWLVPVETVRMDRGRLQLTVKPGTRLAIKTPFTLENPGRLVIDLPGLRLGGVGLPFMPNSIEGVPIKTIRVGQLDMNTVRLVIEADAPDRLQVAVDKNRLIVSELQPSLLGSMMHSIFGERSQSPAPPQRPTPIMPPSKPAVSAGLPVMPPVQSPIQYPDLSNLKKLESESGYTTMNGRLLDRGRVLELARSQVGLSKDANPDYVNQTFSLGQDQDWCADFVSTILDWAGGSPWGHLSRVQDIYTWALSNHRFTRMPAPGDVVVFSYGGTGLNHVALVESISPTDGTLTTIGGNEGHAVSAYKTNGSVARSVYPLDDRRILGFVDPVANPMGGEFAGNAPMPPVLPDPPF